MPIRRSVTHSVTHSVTDSAALLLSDAETVDRCTARLRALAQRLRDDPAIPPWFAAVADAHLTACTIAAADLSHAAARLHALAEPAPRTTTPRLRKPRRGNRRPRATDVRDRPQS